VNLKIVLSQIDRCSDKFLHGRPPFCGAPATTFWHLMPLRWGRPHIIASSACDEAIHAAALRELDCFASLAMTMMEFCFRSQTDRFRRARIGYEVALAAST
jgi:hypothetical protein